MPKAKTQKTPEERAEAKERLAKGRARADKWDKERKAKKAAEAKAKKAQPKRTTARAKTPKTPTRAAIIPVSPPKTPKVTSEYSLEFLQGVLEKADVLDEDVGVLGGKIDKLSDKLEGVSQKVKLNSKTLIVLKKLLSEHGIMLEKHDNKIARLEYCVFAIFACYFLSKILEVVSA